MSMFESLWSITNDSGARDKTQWLGALVALVEDPVTHMVVYEDIQAYHTLLDPCQAWLTAEVQGYLRNACNIKNTRPQKTHPLISPLSLYVLIAKGNEDATGAVLGHPPSNRTTHTNAKY